MFSEKLPQHRSMASRLELAVTPEGEVGCVGEGSEHLEDPTTWWLGQFRPVSTRESPPLGLGLGRAGRPDEGFAGGKIRQPDVIVICARKVLLGDSARGASDRADPYPLAGGAGRSESYDPNGHGITRSPSRPVYHHEPNAGCVDQKLEFPFTAYQVVDKADWKNQQQDDATPTNGARNQKEYGSHGLEPGNKA